jgi:hypothetical protein
VRLVEMTNSVDKTLQNIIDQSMTNAFGGQVEEVIEELTEDEKRKKKIAEAIAEAQEARRIAAEKELEEAKTAIHKSETATTSDEKEREIVEKNVKNKIEINPDMKESIVGKIYDMYNNKYLSEKQYTLTNADKKGNTPAWQNRNKKNVKTGEPLYKKADHMKKEEVEAQKKTLTIEDTDKIFLLKAGSDEAYEVTDLLLPDPLHELNRFEKEQGKKSGGSKDKALNFVRNKIRKETGRPEGQRKKVKGAKSDEKNTSLQKKIDKLKSKRAYADRAKKAGFKSTQDYTNTVARYGGEDNYKKGRGLGT